MYTEFGVLPSVRASLQLLINWLFITFYEYIIAICTYKCICTNTVIFWCIVLYCFTLNMDFESEIKQLH